MILTVFQSDKGYKLHVDLKPLTRQIVPIILSGSGSSYIQSNIFHLFPDQVRALGADEDGNYCRPSLQGSMGVDTYSARVLDILWLAKDGAISSIEAEHDRIKNILADLSAGTRTLHDRFKRDLILYDIKIKEKL